MSVRRTAPVFASQTFAVMSPVVTICDPSGLKHTDDRAVVWPRSVRSLAPVFAFQTFAVLSSPAVTMRESSGLKLAVITLSVGS